MQKPKIIVDYDLDDLLQKGEITEEDINSVLVFPSTLLELVNIPSFSHERNCKPQAKEGQKFIIKIDNQYYTFKIYQGDAIEMAPQHCVWETRIGRLKELKVEVSLMQEYLLWVYDQGYEKYIDSKENPCWIQEKVSTIPFTQDQLFTKFINSIEQ
jgi:hypothetical protein